MHPTSKVYAIVGKARVAVLQGQLDRAQQLLDDASVTMRESHVDSSTSGALVRDSTAALARVAKR